jgi:hypothetical protein
VETALFLLWFSFFAAVDTRQEAEKIGVSRLGKLQKEDMWLSRLIVG